MIKLSGCANTVFEEAYFILKPGVNKNIMTESELIKEANRIIEESSYKYEKKNGGFVKISTVSFFILIALCTAGISFSLFSIIF